MSVYRASDKQEAHLQRTPGPDKNDENGDDPYAATLKDRLIWYVKLIVSEAIERHIPYVALGLGSYVYRYRYSDVWRLHTDVEDKNVYGQVNKLILKLIGNRFPELRYETKSIFVAHRRRPSQEEIELVDEALKRFTPWRTDHLKSMVSYKDGKKSDIDDWTHIHALIDTSCAGLERLVSGANYRKGDDLMIPYFSQGDDRSNGTDQGHEDRRFNPAKLSAEEITDIRKEADDAQRRRRQYRAGTLRALVDGEERAEFELRNEARSVVLHVPSYASFLEVYGVDDQGECLLAMFPLHGLESGDRLRVRLEGGQKLFFDVLGAEKMDEGVEQWCVQLTCEDPWRLAPLSFLAELSQAVGLRGRRLGSLKNAMAFLRQLLPDQPGLFMRLRWAALGSIVALSILWGQSHWFQENGDALDLRAQLQAQDPFDPPGGWGRYSLGKDGW